MAKAGRGSEQVMIRLPDGMRDRIKAAAEQNNRSMNAEIVAALEEAFPEAEHYVEELSFIDEIDEIQQKLERIRRAQYELHLQRAKADLLEVEKSMENADKLLGGDQKE